MTTQSMIGHFHLMNLKSQKLSSLPLSKMRLRMCRMLCASETHWPLKSMYLMPYQRHIWSSDHPKRCVNKSKISMRNNSTTNIHSSYSFDNKTRNMCYLTCQDAQSNGFKLDKWAHGCPNWWERWIVHCVHISGGTTSIIEPVCKLKTVNVFVTFKMIHDKLQTSQRQRWLSILEVGDPKNMWKEENRFAVMIKPKT